MIKEKVIKPAEKMNGKETAMAITRSSSTTFQVPKTYDMVRSLFDPTLRKSYLELGITSSLILNCWFCYYCTTRFGKEWASCIFLSQYILWRLSYNLGIGLVLHYQSHHEFLTEFAKRHKLFEKNENATLLARFCQFEIQSKMTPDYDFSSYPPEFNIWLLFRQFVDLVLMQDFTTYMLYVVLSLPEGLTLGAFTQLSLESLRFYVGIGMLLFNIWVKIDAHRVVKDYAWYWGDFFFLLQDSNLIFDGVFNISPHPMYSIGYLGYYGLSLITGKYQVLLVSIMGHLLQFLFLKYVETPHIERIYGPEQPESVERIDDLLVKNNHNYTKPLMAIHCCYSNFDPLRPTDFITVGSAVSCVLAVLILSPSPKAMFCFSLLVKLSATITNVFILHQQSKNKWFTKLFMRNGYTQLYSYQIWQFIYNYNISLSYLALALQAYTEYKSNSSHDLTTVIFGFILIALHAWSDSEILSAISEFGWFYGDFFLTNYIRRPKLASHGIYRYLNNPECVLGVAGPWGTVLITNFSTYNVILATFWTLSNYIMVTFVEAPHVAKVYGSDVLGRQSGVSKALMGFAPIKVASIMVDKFASTLVDMLSVSNDSREQLEDVLNIAFQAATKKMAPNCEFEIYSSKGKIVGASGGGNEQQNVYIGDKIEVKWKLPANLYHKDDWVGLYKVLETGEDRFRTRISSDGHWCATNPAVYAKNQKASQAVLEFKSNDFFASGRVLFDHNLLYFEKGIYEFRYHSTNGHKVLMISPPFRIGFPAVKTDSPEGLYQSVTALLKSCHCLDSKNRFNPQANKHFSERTLQKLFRYTTGADISSDYMRRVDYDMEVITKAIFDMKKILDSLH